MTNTKDAYRTAGNELQGLGGRGLILVGLGITIFLIYRAIFLASASQCILTASMKLQLHQEPELTVRI